MSIKAITAEPFVSVGILTAPAISAVLSGTYICDGEPVTGPVEVSHAPDGSILWNGRTFDHLEFEAAGPDCTFELKDVVIGVQFHWERRENQRFSGGLTFLNEHGHLTAVNIVPVEDYLKSVISSEMSATASLELLKAHAVISRSWLLAQIEKHNSIAETCAPYAQGSETAGERIRWYDREDHVNFHVCADDHCQRYQGITRRTTAKVEEAVETTRGRVLVYGNLLCDARFSKCCGGVFERFENCWEPVPHHYLGVRRDSADETDYPDLRNELHARRWIESSPEAFCNTADADILAQVLNNYDRETTDFYRWSVTYTAAELSELVRRRSGIDFGRITALEPLERGTSGRIVRLRITGTRRTMVIGKELEIRRTLSPSHLYSSAFTVHPGPAGADGLSESFTLRGAGWGHGVGLCQIGAAVMGARGYSYDRILNHYFIDAEIKRLYN